MTSRRLLTGVRNLVQMEQQICWIFKNAEGAGLLKLGEPITPAQQAHS